MECIQIINNSLEIIISVDESLAEMGRCFMVLQTNFHLSNPISLNIFLLFFFSLVYLKRKANNHDDLTMMCPPSTHIYWHSFLCSIIIIISLLLFYPHLTVLLLLFLLLPSSIIFSPSFNFNILIQHFDNLIIWFKTDFWACLPLLSSSFTVASVFCVNFSMILLRKGTTKVSGD